MTPIAKARIWRCRYFACALFSLLVFNSCSLLLESKVNKKFPKVSPEARKVQNLISSSFALTQIDTACIGVSLPADRLKESLIKAMKKQRIFNINDADSIVLDTSAIKVTFDNQEIRLESDAMVFISPTSNLKLLKSFRFHLKGFVSPYFSDAAQELKTTLHLDPNVEELKISKIKFRNFFLNALNPIAQYIVNDFSKRFIENINGLIPDVRSDIDMSFLYQKKYSELINSPEITTVKDDAIEINKKLGNKAVLIRPQGLAVVSDVKEVNPVLHAAVASIGNIDKVAVRNIISKHAPAEPKKGLSISEADIKSSEFNQLFGQYKSDFSRAWDVSLDSFERIDASHINTQISQKFIVSFTNQLLNHPAFAFMLAPQTLPTVHIDKTRIELLEKPKWDCNQIEFHCDLPNCNNVLHNCGSCRWWDVPCHIGWVACQAANGAAYAGCQAFKVAKLGTCTVSYLGQKAFCFAKYAVLYAAHDLVSIGDIEGNINVTVSGSGQLGRFSLSNDLGSFALNTDLIKGQGTFSGRIDYSKDWEQTLTSVLQCNCLGVYVPIPIGCSFDIPAMNGVFDFPEAVSGNIQKIQDTVNNRARLVITTNEIPIQIQIKDQTPFQAIFANSTFVLRCQILFFGTALWGIAGNFFKFNDKLQEKYDAVFKGLYTYKLSPKQFQIDLSHITFNVPTSTNPIVLNSLWTNKSLTYKE